MAQRIIYERIHPETQTVTIESALPAEFVDRQSAAGFLRDPGGRILVFESCSRRLFDVPGGGLDMGEDDAAALVREFEEEVGLKVAVEGFVCERVNFFSWSDWPPQRCFRRYYAVRCLGGRLKADGDGSESFGAHWRHLHELDETNTLGAVLEALPEYRTFLAKRGA